MTVTVVFYYFYSIIIGIINIKISILTLLNSPAELKGGIDGAYQSFQGHCKTVQRDCERLNSRGSEFVKRKREQAEANEDNENGKGNIPFTPVIVDHEAIKALEDEINKHMDKMSALFDQRHALVTVHEETREAESFAVCSLPTVKRQRTRSAVFRAGRSDAFRDEMITKLFVASCGGSKEQEASKKTYQV